MTDASKTAAAKKKPAAQPAKARPSKAVAEVLNQPRTLETHGLTLTIPAELPFEVLRFIGDDAQAGPAQMIGILKAVLGEEQLKAVWEARLSMPAGIELVEVVMAEYGTSSGESSASASS